MKPVTILSFALAMSAAAGALAFVRVQDEQDTPAAPPVATAPDVDPIDNTTVSIGPTACPSFNASFIRSVNMTSDFDVILRARDQVVVCSTHSMEAIKGSPRNSSFMNVMAVIASHADTPSQRIPGIQITLTRLADNGQAIVGACNLGLDEAEALSKALLYFSQAPGTTAKRPDNTKGGSVSYATKSGLQIAQERVPGEFPASVTVGLDTLLPVTVAFRNANALSTFKRELDEGIGWLRAQ